MQIVACLGVLCCIPAATDQRLVRTSFRRVYLFATSAIVLVEEDLSCGRNATYKRVSRIVQYPRGDVTIMESAPGG